MLDIGLDFLLKLTVELEKVTSKSFAPSSGSYRISEPNLENLYLTDFEACSANQCTQNQLKAFFTNFLCWIVLFGFLLKLDLELKRVTSK